MYVKHTHKESTLTQMTGTHASVFTQNPLLIFYKDMWSHSSTIM